MGVAERIQIIDIAKKEDGSIVTISGIIVNKYKASKSLLVVTIKDFSETVKVNVTLSDSLNQAMFWKGTRLQLTGTVISSMNGERRIDNISNVLIFSKNENNNSISIDNLDVDIQKKASQILMSSICRSVSSQLLTDGFVEFESRMISYTWQMDGLEALNVVYPGFGSPVTLITSPSPQIIDFIKTAMVSRAFTVTTSFATTFRFKDGATETRVIMAKALDLSEKELVSKLFLIAQEILKQFGETDFCYPNLEKDTQRLQWSDVTRYQLDNTVNIVIYDTNFEIHESNYDSKIKRVIHIIDKDNNILAEGSLETMANALNVSTLTFYPSQFLGVLKKAQSRQLQELWRKHGW